MCDGNSEGRSFLLHLRCEGCQKLSSRELPIPPLEDVPTTIEDLMESGLLQNLKFFCPRCESVIGRVVAVNMREGQAAA